MRLYEGAEDTERMIRVEVEVAIDFGEDRRSDIRMIVSRERGPVEDEGFCPRVLRGVVPS